MAEEARIRGAAFAAGHQHHKHHKSRPCAQVSAPPAPAVQAAEDANGTPASSLSLDGGEAPLHSALEVLGEVQSSEKRGSGGSGIASGLRLENVSGRLLATPQRSADRRHEGPTSARAYHNSRARTLPPQVSMTFKNHQVLKDCSWEVKKGERVGLVGESSPHRRAPSQVPGRPQHGASQ